MYQDPVLLRVMLDTFSMVKEISVMEQRYQAVLAVIADGRGVGEVAAQFGVSRQSVHAWLRRYEDHGLEGLANRSHKPKSMPHQMPALVEAAIPLHDGIAEEADYVGFTRLGKA